MAVQNQTKTQSTLKSESFDKAQERPVEVMPVREMKVLLSWKAPIRVFKRRDREFWTTVGSIVFLLAIILFFIKEWLLIATIIALVFVYYVLSSVPPEEVEHQITTRGLRFAGRDFFWEELGRYWFSERWSQKIFNIEIGGRLPGRLELLLGEMEEKKIKDVVGKYLLEETPQPSFLDRASDWLTKRIPLEIGK